MTDRTSRHTALIAIVAVVVVVAVGGTSYVIGRSGQPATPPTIAATTSTVTAPSPTYAPTDRNGSPEPGLATGLAIAGQGGSTTGPDGLPLGYTHDETGAVNAATNYLMWMNSLRITDEAAADAMAASTAADPATRRSLAASFDALRSGMTDLTADQPEPARGAYALATFRTDAALVYVWAPEVITDASGQTQHLWSISGIKLVWAQNDWKLQDELVSKVGAAAVDPSDAAGNPSSAEKHSILRRTPADPGDITDSADQTWFEYANAPH